MKIIKIHDGLKWVKNNLDTFVYLDKVNYKYSLIGYKIKNGVLYCIIATSKGKYMVSDLIKNFDNNITDDGAKFEKATMIKFDDIIKLNK